MAKRNIEEQFKDSIVNFEKIVANHMAFEMSRFGDRMIDNVLPKQAEFRNLTGNTITSFAYGVYINHKIHTIGLFSGEPAIRVKLSKGEVLRNFTDYDGNTRQYFVADIDTDRTYGNDTSYQFLSKYKPKGKYALIFTTGTEYSAYLENVLNLNVLTDSIDTVRSELLRSFKPI